MDTAPPTPANSQAPSSPPASAGALHRSGARRLVQDDNPPPDYFEDHYLQTFSHEGRKINIYISTIFIK